MGKKRNWIIGIGFVAGFIITGLALKFILPRGFWGNLIWLAASITVGAFIGKRGVGTERCGFRRRHHPGNRQPNYSTNQFSAILLIKSGGRPFEWDLQNAVSKND